MKYANLTTNQMFVDILPNRIITPEGITQDPTMAQLEAIGWREQVAVDLPTEGFRVLTYGIQEIDAHTCKLIVTAEKNIAEEQAEQEAAAEAARIAARQAKLDNFQASDLDLMEFIFRVRNYGLPVQYQVTLAQAKEIWRKVVDKEA